MSTSGFNPLIRCRSCGRMGHSAAACPRHNKWYLPGQPNPGAQPEQAGEDWEAAWAAENEPDYYDRVDALVAAVETLLIDSRWIIITIAGRRIVIGPDCYNAMEALHEALDALKAARGETP